jgi:hypothetical protein
LLRENPQTRSAVRDCMFETRVREHYPRTHRVLQEAPPVHWPTDVAYERSWAPQAAPPKKGWKP